VNSERPATTCRLTPGIADGLLAMGLAVIMIGLLAVISGLADSAAFDRPGGHGAPVAVSSDPLVASRVASSGRRMERDAHREQGDARLYLRDAAAAALRYPWAGAWQGETRTDLWINAPRFIGSTSPPDTSPSTPPSWSDGRFR
jgi:hypothetical protein